MKKEELQLIEGFSGHSFTCAKRAYYLKLAGYTNKEIAKLLSDEPPRWKAKDIPDTVYIFSLVLKFEAEVENHRQELMKTKTPYWDRELDSWENRAITRTSKSDSSGLWYASLDSRGYKYCGLDFSTCCQTKEDAIRLCALKLRLDNLGIGKYAPHDDLGKSLYYHSTYWIKKEYRYNSSIIKKRNSIVLSK